MTFMMYVYLYNCDVMCVCVCVCLCLSIYHKVYATKTNTSYLQNKPFTMFHAYINELSQ